MSRRRVLTSIILFFLIGAGAAWLLSSQGIIQNSWSTPLGTLFSVLGVLIAFFQWTIPLSSAETKPSTASLSINQAQETLLKQIGEKLTEDRGAVTIYEEKDHIGRSVDLISDSSSKEARLKANIVERTIRKRRNVGTVILL